MKKEIVSSLAEPVGELWRNLQTKQEGLFLVASPLSRTPLPIYEWIIQNAGSFSNWDNFRFVFMDEQVLEVNEKLHYVPIDNPASLEGFGRKHFLHPLSKQVSLPEEQMILKPDPENFQEFDSMIEQHHGLDLLILAIGEEGHYALVMPGTPLEKGYHAARLSPKVIAQHIGEGGPYEGSNFSERGMSLGPKQVLSAKNVVVIISGEKKRDLARELFSYTSFNSEFPLSIIYHPKVKDEVKIYMTEDVV